MIFYNTLKTQIELLPRMTILYKKGFEESGWEIGHNGIGIEWLWFGVFIKLQWL